MYIQCTYENDIAINCWFAIKLMPDATLVNQFSCKILLILYSLYRFLKYVCIAMYLRYIVNVLKSHTLGNWLLSYLDYHERHPVITVLLLTMLARLQLMKYLKD